RRELIVQTEKLKAERNEASQQIAVMKRNKENADEAIAKTREVGDQIKVIDDELHEVEEKLDYIMMRVPNIPHDSVPFGDSEDDNEEIRTWGEQPQFGFEAKPHWDIATELNIVDFERAA
ncbi:serine--tRNA ligase, partial [Bacillus sp. SIMBA_161]